MTPTGRTRDGDGFWSLRGSPVLVFRVLLAGVMLSTGVGVWYALAHRGEFQAAFPGTVDNRVYFALLVIGACGLVALVGMWVWRPWAVILYAAVTAATLTTDILAGAPVLHQITVALGAGAMFTLAYLNRGRFGNRPNDRGE